MKKFKKIWLASFLSIYLLAGLLLFVPVSAQASIFDPTKNIDFTPQIGVPNSEFTAGTAVGVGNTAINAKGETVVRSDLLARYINAFYQWGLSIVAVIAVVVLMAGGVMWIASAGDSSLVTKAKEMIIGSLSGMALLIGAWFFLNTINPQLTQLPAIEMVIINKITMGCCNSAKDDGKTKMTTEEKCKSGFDQNKSLVSGKCEAEVCCVYRRTLSTGTACFQSFSNSCSIKVGGLDGVSLEGKCADITECKTITNCAGVTDGKKASDSFGSENYLYCYNGRAYPSSGAQLQEPCGIKSGGYGICIKSEDTCKDPNQLGGRRCGSLTDFSMKCCLD